MMVLQGQRAHFQVFYDDTLTNGAKLADAVLAGCENDLSRLSTLFGGIMPASLPIVVNLMPADPSATPPLAGAHWSGGTITCYVYAGDTDGLRYLILTDAEVAEMLMAAQNLGFVPYYSNGEALSRVLAAVLYPDRAYLLSTCNYWLNTGRPDFLSIVDHSDQRTFTIGCGALFLNYLAHQLNFTWEQIIAAAGPTLAQTAANLKVPNAPADFFSLIDARFPLGWSPHWNLPDDNPFPLMDQPYLYIRDTLIDDGISPSQPIGDSPDIIVKNSYLGQGVVALYTPPSIYSDTESDPYVLAGQGNYLYLRTWNRGPAINDVETAVYWSEVATLVTPNLWNLIASYGPEQVPLTGAYTLRCTDGLCWDASKIPAPGHYCFVATVGDAANPAPDPAKLTFGNFDDYINYIAVHNNIAWRNFNVSDGSPQQGGAFDEFINLPFHITGAWDRERAFEFQTIGALPQRSNLVLDLPHDLALRFKPQLKKLDVHKHTTGESRARMTLPPHIPHPLGTIHLPAGTKGTSHLLVQLPEKLTQRHEVAIRQLYKGREVGRITWIFGAVKRLVEPRLRPQHEAVLRT